MKKPGCMLAALLLAALPATAAVQERAPARANTVQVSAEGKHEADPDTALLQFHIAAQAGTSRAAYDGAARAAEQVRALLRKAGVDPKSAEFGSFSIQPVYEWRPQQRLTGFRAAASVALRLKDFTQVGPVVQQLADVEGVGSHTVNYILEDLDEAKNRAVADAMRRARASAAVVAEAGGRTLGEMNHAAVDTEEQSRPMLMMARAEAAPDAPLPPTAEFTPQRVVVTARVSAVFNLR